MKKMSKLRDGFKVHKVKANIPKPIPPTATEVVLKEIYQQGFDHGKNASALQLTTERAEFEAAKLMDSGEMRQLKIKTRADMIQAIIKANERLTDTLIRILNEGELR